MDRYVRCSFLTIAAQIAALCVLVSTLNVKASVVYGCNTWPNSFESALIVDCAESDLSDPIPSELWEGSKFLIDISRNDLQGELNMEGASLSNSIRSIAVTHNQLTGELPSTLPNQIKDLYFGENDFTGELPSTWSSAINLRTIDLHGNVQVTGLLPEEWSSLSKLELLDLRGTGLGGNIPNSLGALNRLNSFLVDGCNFTGCVPVGIPFTVPSVQVSGFVLHPCTKSPTQLPTESPTTSRPSEAPSSRPSVSPSKSPSRRTRRPTLPGETEQPTQAPGLTSESNAVLGIGIGVGVTAILIVGVIGIAVFWKFMSKRNHQKGNNASFKKEQLVPAEKDGENAPPPPARPPPPPSGPRPGRTFVPGQGWTQDKSTTTARLEPTPPPAPRG